MKQYPDEFLEEGSHGRCHELLAAAGLDPGVVLDLGCASGQLAEPVTALGHEYVGSDIDREALDELAARGFETHEIDLSVGEDRLVVALRALLGERRLAAVLLLDVIEHLVDPDTLLRALARLAAEHAGMQVIVSIPNVTHVDVGIKLLLGRWDVTDTGLLDDTHVRFFNERLVRETLARNGWAEAAVNDVTLPFSDQLYPVDAPALRPGAPLRQLLWRIRTAADPHAETYQFVRRFSPAPAAATGDQGDQLGRHQRDEMFLTVVVRTSARSTGSIDRLLGDLAGQSVGDVEVLVSHPDGDEVTVAPPPGLDGSVRLVPTPPATDWRDVAMGAARGRYVVLLDDRTRLSSRYVETVQHAVEALPGRVVQVGASAAPVAVTDELADIDAAIEALDTIEPVELDPLDLVTGAPFGAVALGAHAVPRHAWATNGLRFDAGDADDGEAAPTLFLLRAVELCGIVRSGERVLVLHPAAVHELATDVESLQKHLSLSPLIVPEGAGSQVLALRQTVSTELPQRHALAEQLATARDQIASLSWHLRQRDVELEQAAGEARALREAAERRVTTRARRKLGAAIRRI